MSVLTRRDLEEVVGALARIHQASDLGGFPARVLDALRGLVGSEITCYTEMNPARRRAAFEADPPDEELDSLQPTFARFQLGHPRLEDFLAGRTCEARMISDFLSEREWHARPIYDHFFRKLGLEDQVTIMMPAPPPVVVGVALNRKGRTFTQRDREVLDLLVPHFSVAYGNALAVDGLRRACETYGRALEELADGLICLSPDLVPTSATRKARELLGRYFSIARSDGAALPETLASWVRAFDRETDGNRIVGRPRGLVVAGPDHSLTVRLVPQVEGGWLLLLEERPNAPEPTEDPRVVTLPPRLRQVLDLLLSGDGEKQVAAKLELSRHTVHDYVKELYRRLDVSSRSELLALWVTRDGHP